MNAASCTDNSPFSKLGLGTGMLASWRGGLSFAEATTLLDAARDMGVNLIDTADSYASGECERLLGKLLKRHNQHFHLMTKAGYATADLPGPLHRLNPLAKKLLHKLGKRQCFEPDYLKRSLAKSLQRLRTDHVAVFLLHDPTAGDLADGKVFATLDQFKRSGMAARTGISSGDDDALRLALGWPGCDVIQTPLIAPGGLANPFQSLPAHRPLIILNHVSLGGRLPGINSPPDPELEDLRHRIRNQCEQRILSPWSALLATARETTGADCVLTGTRNSDHLRDNATAVMQTA